MLWVELQQKRVKQTLEGKYKDVLVLFEKIRLDNRHTDIVVEERKFVDQRSFQKWGVMTLVVTSELDLKKTCASSPQILQIEYTSKLKKSEDVEPILSFARARNELLTIGGMMWLFLKTGVVRQVLEGPEEVIVPLVEKIQKDS
mmetsp:Transcript_1442/g.1784  ORF Transcript_1442/g.1784 Transcript_1442/m.1784 type:complete len:144 (-) Transcript_1442:230-661(-)